jgi:hypothetical protein
MNDEDRQSSIGLPNNSLATVLVHALLSCWIFTTSSTELVRYGTDSEAEEELIENDLISQKD